MIIEVTEFVRPYGHKNQQTLEVDDMCQNNYDKLQEMGFRLTAELIRMNEISICVEHPNVGDLQCEIIKMNSGKTLAEHFKNLILKFNVVDAAKFIDFGI